MRRLHLFVLGLAFLANADCSGDTPRGADAGAPLRRFEFSQIHMGTQFRLVFYAQGEHAATTASKDAFQRIAELDQTLSDYSDTSELTCFSQQSGRGPVSLSDDLWTVLSRAQEIAKRTDGSFDVTVGPAVRLWRRARRLKQLPTEDQIDRALERVGFQKLHLDPASRTGILDRDGMRIDLGGIAKGYATDEALKVLAQHGVERAMVVGGGQVSMGAPPPDEIGWTIAIQPIGETKAAAPEYVTLCHASVSTSGDAAQFVLLGGKRYSHIVDPHTGWALSTRRQVTIVAKDGMTADALGSGLSVLGPERALATMEKVADAVCRIEELDESGQSRVWKSKRWPANGELEIRGAK